MHPDAKDAAGERTFCAASWKRADGQKKSPSCDKAVLGVVVVGPGYGEAFPVCVNKDCDVHWKAERLPREKHQARSGGGKAFRGGPTRSRRADVGSAPGERRGQAEGLDDSKPAIILALAKTLKDRKIAALTDLVLAHLDSRNKRSMHKMAPALLDAPKTADAALRHAAFLVLIFKLDEWNAPKTFPPLARKLGVDVAAIRTAQAKATPSPSGDPDGTPVGRKKAPKSGGMKKSTKKRGAKR